MTRHMGVLIPGLEPLLPHPPSRVVSQIKMSIMRYFLYRHDYRVYIHRDKHVTAKGQKMGSIFEKDCDIYNLCTIGLGQKWAITGKYD